MVYHSNFPQPHVQLSNSIDPAQRFLSPECTPRLAAADFHEQSTADAWASGPLRGAATRSPKSLAVDGRRVRATGARRSQRLAAAPREPLEALRARLGGIGQCRAQESRSPREPLSSPRISPSAIDQLVSLLPVNYRGGGGGKAERARETRKQAAFLINPDM